MFLNLDTIELLGQTAFCCWAVLRIGIIKGLTASLSSTHQMTVFSLPNPSQYNQTLVITSVLRVGDRGTGSVKNHQSKGNGDFHYSLQKSQSWDKNKVKGKIFPHSAPPEIGASFLSEGDLLKETVIEERYVFCLF